MPPRRLRVLITVDAHSGEVPRGGDGGPGQCRSRVHNVGGVLTRCRVHRRGRRGRPAEGEHQRDSDAGGEEVAGTGQQGTCREACHDRERYGAPTTARIPHGSDLPRPPNHPGEGCPALRRALVSESMSPTLRRPRPTRQRPIRRLWALRTNPQVRQYGAPALVVLFAGILFAVAWPTFPPHPFPARRDRPAARRRRNSARDHRRALAGGVLAGRRGVLSGQPAVPRQPRLRPRLAGGLPPRTRLHPRGGRASRPGP
ncbi:hypothetical protein CVAR21S_02771 [Corynebacterium variabile]